MFLDFDGTLAEIAPRPDLVSVAPRLPGLLRTVWLRQDGALAIITGRRLEDVDAFLAPLQLPGAGLHGVQLRLAPHGEIQERQVPAVARIVHALRQRYGADPELMIEDKGATVALHFRAAPGRGSECEQALRELAEPAGLELIHGKMVVEARPHGANKAQALRELRAHAPFAGRAPVFVGDDATDEPAFAVAQLAGGLGVKVGEGPTAARHRVGGVAQVQAWLRAAVAEQAETTA